MIEGDGEKSSFSMGCGGLFRGVLKGKPNEILMGLFGSGGTMMGQFKYCSTLRAIHFQNLGGKLASTGSVNNERMSQND